MCAKGGISVSDTMTDAMSGALLLPKILSATFATAGLLALGLALLGVYGVMSIQAGDNPRNVYSKLMTFVPPGDRISEDDQSAAA